MYQILGFQCQAEELSIEYGFESVDTSVVSHRDDAELGTGRLAPEGEVAPPKVFACFLYLLYSLMLWYPLFYWLFHVSANVTIAPRVVAPALRR